MENEDYQEVLVQLALMARVVQGIKPEEFIRSGEIADTIGPFVDPTLWQKRHRDLDKTQKLARSLLHFQNTVMEVLALDRLAEDAY